MKAVPLRLALLLSFVYLSVAAIAAGCSAQEPRTESAPQATAELVAPIVGGEPENGWEGVGAMTSYYPGYGYAGSFCSATLIAEQWLLTAAHCLSDHNGIPVTPDTVQFYVGPDARPGTWGGYPDTGTLYPARVFFVHPDYDPQWTFNDIGLVYLDEPANGVPAYPISETPLTDEHVGTPVLYVGFGVTSGATYEGGGRKRAAESKIGGVGDTHYSSSFRGTGVCFGDSGGPGLLEIDGEYHVIGVNSTVAGDRDDPCRGNANHTRVDAFATWILDHVNGPPPNCNTDAGLCSCTNACLADGTCDNDLCRTLSCRAITACIGECPGGSDICVNRCYSLANGQAIDRLRSMYRCIYRNCEGISGVDYQVCVADHCQSQVDRCMRLATGDATCRAVDACARECTPGYDECQTRCLELGTSDSQQSYGDMRDCGKAACGEDPDADRDVWIGCLHDTCAAEVDACIEPARCDPRGGDCPAGRACTMTPTGATDCLPSAGAAHGAPCDPAAFVPLPCADGLTCVTDDQGPLCQPFCVDDDDCAGDVACVGPRFDEDDTWGVCLCRDDDGDLFCAQDDCDEDDPGVHPGAPDLCGDGVDGDCDGTTDDGCEPDKPDVTAAPPDAATNADVTTGSGSPEVQFHDSAEGEGGSNGGAGCSAAIDRAVPGASGLLVLLLLGAIVRRRRSF